MYTKGRCSYYCMVTDDDDNDDVVVVVNYGITTPNYNCNVGADDDVDYEDRYDDDDDDLYALKYASVLCWYFICLNYLRSFTTFLSAIIDFFNSSVLMRLYQPNGEIAYIYGLTI